uniref:BZIP domain-containing protein n=2 Tax=Brassica oleracea TaxID=3712 RepID=A0A0D3DSA2_BRAOL|nr:unnamed protein product [Brassica oleracea]
MLIKNLFFSTIIPLIKKPSNFDQTREAVRKYREKKKARTAYLEDEVKRLQSLNEYLFRKLQSQAMVETKIIKLRALLVEMQVKIDDELGGFSFQKQCNGSGFVFKEGDVSLLCWLYI